MRTPPIQPGRAPLRIDFVSGALGFRLGRGEGRGGALARAVGLTRGRSLEIADATAGLGRDGFLLGALGAQVTMIERNAEVHDALARALEAARDHSDELAAIVARITLINADSRDVLATLSPQVVLVDPMHPERKKSALVKKQMRDLRDVVGPDADSRDLMEAALAAATERVVLKWPARAAPIAGLRTPSHQIAGKTTRYDVFVV